MRKRSICALLASLLLLAVQVDASKAQATDEESPWGVTLDFAYSGSFGNQQLNFIDGGARVTRLESDAAEFELSARARSGTDNGERVAERYTTSLRADAFPESDWSPFVFGSAERDRFKELDLRTNTGGGVKYTFLRNDATLASVSVAVLHNREDFRLPAQPTHTDGRLSWRVRARHEVREGVRVENESYYQPVWDQAGDYTIESETVLAVQLFSILAVTTSYEFQRDSTPPEDVKPDDHNIRVGVQLSF